MKPAADDPLELRVRFDRELAAVPDVRALSALRTAWLGKKGGVVTLALAELRSLSGDDRRERGREVNELKQHVEAELARAEKALEGAETRAKLLAESVDPTLPAALPDLGGLHPIRLMQDEIEEFFLGLGYSVMDGPEIEDDYHNFEALNIPADHPARDSHDTFYVPGALLRTHTSPVQIRTMLAQPPPLRIICPGKVYRRDSDASHSPMFTQFEGLVVGEGVSFADFKGTISLFFRRLLGPRVDVRMRPSYFPFTEPSAEVDISCVLCDARGCPACKGSGWMEVMGAGMVHPAVFESVGYDPERWTGFAFGGGIDRMAMLAYRVPHIQLLFENDVRLLRQFR